MTHIHLSAIIVVALMIALPTGCGCSLDFMGGGVTKTQL